MIEFKAVVISYHNAPLDIREAVALDEGEVRALLIKLREVLDLSETLVVSTCNRTEIYYSSQNTLDQQLISLLAAHKSVQSTILASYFKSYSNSESIKHLFEVALGLDSQVLGDIQISNQIKRAYQASADLEMAGPFLHRLMHTIFYANKRVVQETRLQDGNASVASVSAELIKRFIEKISLPKIAILGLGEIGQNVLENLGEIEAEITLLNRTRTKADELAVLPNCAVEDFENRHQVIERSDIIISALGSSAKAIEKSNLANDDFQHRLLIDLSVPRSINDQVGELPGVTLYNVDDLTVKTKKARTIREASVPEAQLIIADCLDGFNEWKEEMEVSPTIQKLKNTLDQIRKQELARHSGKVSEQEMNLLEVVTKNMIQKVLKLPVLQLKAACRRGDSENLVEVLNDLFNLDQDEVKKA